MVAFLGIASFVLLVMIIFLYYFILFELHFLKHLYIVLVMPAILMWFHLG